jgi:hypothetical protein
MEVYGAAPNRAKAKCRKAYTAGELALSSEAQYPPGGLCVVATESV